MNFAKNILQTSVALLLAEVLLSEPSSTLEGGIFVRRSSAFFEFGRVSLCNMEGPQRRELASQDMRQMESKHARSPKTQKCGRVALCKLGAPDKAGRIFKPVKTRVGTSPRSKATSAQLVRTTHTQCLHTSLHQPTQLEHTHTTYSIEQDVGKQVGAGKSPSKKARNYG